MKQEVINWLLEEENPAIRYRTLTEICGIPRVDCEADYNELSNNKVVLRMLQKQDGLGLWSDSEYGMFTSLRYLTAFAEYGIYKDSRLDRYADKTIKLFLTKSPLELGSCSVPLTLRALVMLGYHERDDVKELINKYALAQLGDGGFMCKGKLEKKPDRKSCYKASIASLLLYAECCRKNIIIDNTDYLLNYFIKRNVFYSSDKSIRFDEGRFGWRLVDNFFPVEPMRMGLPMIVSALAILKAGNNQALVESWNMLNEKKNAEGKLSLEGTLTKQPCSFGKVGLANKWVTFYALLAEINK